MTTRRCPQLFTPDQAPRRPRRVMMHVIDAGSAPDGTDIVRLSCRICRHDTGWVVSRTVSEERLGRPCPNCNPVSLEAVDA